MTDFDMECMKKALLSEPNHVLMSLYLLTQFMPKEGVTRIHMIGPDGPIVCGGQEVVINNSTDPQVKKVQLSSVYGETRSSKPNEPMENTHAYTTPWGQVLPCEGTSGADWDSFIKCMDFHHERLAEAIADAEEVYRAAQHYTTLGHDFAIGLATAVYLDREKQYEV